MNGKLTPEEKARIREEKLRREALEREADFAEVEQLLGKDAAVSNAKLRHKLLFSVVRHQCDVHSFLRSVSLADP